MVNKCKDCNKEISYYAKRCEKCYGKTKRGIYPKSLKEHTEKHGAWNKGKKLSEEHKRKAIKTLISYNNDISGKNNPAWKGGDEAYWHRKIREKFIEKGCSPKEMKKLVAHCKNRKYSDQRLSNWELLTRSEHRKLHWELGDYDFIHEGGGD